jgi:hypothetical protein
MLILPLRLLNIIKLLSRVNHKISTSIQLEMVTTLDKDPTIDLTMSPNKGLVRIKVREAAPHTDPITIHVRLYLLMF